MQKQQRTCWRTDCTYHTRWFAKVNGRKTHSVKAVTNANFVRPLLCIFASLHVYLWDVKYHSCNNTCQMNKWQEKKSKIGWLYGSVLAMDSAKRRMTGKRNKTARRSIFWWVAGGKLSAISHLIDGQNFENSGECSLPKGKRKLRLKPRISLYSLHHYRYFFPSA